ncbi:MAG: flagellar biosynthesis protein FlhB [Hyphomonas sp.]|uniref:EscU/YscU/HrcU family type III secretion system export apparatus switch protein n=1 Tax=Hyphomonas sp. TaxID=87 RepID=UPI0017970A61|nr:flagellar type III secretion system protein FlhB [Hyphomonas sp.]MBA3067896.1 flagellar biosynthesis protein FlhB [Hyphomonas sp.]MBU3921793.1 flagellar type III secretion system protein FlhB [Alphaproteobacteria bacterium]MBU4062452.1 flagellar type III secretion system protein FlhB [Alphaproteobacteria bacterium]MBU4165939.1 flagellar type III secretion system protein FlhB [Alphaproteobacteria bacterium]
MAEQDDSSEKEFDATEQRLRQAREEGNVPQSKEANALALILGIVIAAFVLNAVVGQSLFNDFSSMLYHGDTYASDVFSGGGSATWGWIANVMLHLLPIFLVLAAVVLAALVVQRAISFSIKKIELDVKKISPAENIKKRYGTRGLLDFLKDTAKLLFAGLIGVVFLVQFMQDYYASAEMQMGDFYQFTFNQILRLILYFLAFQVALAVIDLPLQRQLHLNKLKMSREEMKKEMKQSEGDPQLKMKRRETAAKISRGQMLQNVKTATVVMVNPTHYAVALKWDPESQKAPVCVAKGVDHLAAKIREIAAENKVPIYRDPPATRSLYNLVEVDEEIRPEHFAAVAAAIQFIDRIKNPPQG